MYSEFMNLARDRLTVDKNYVEVWFSSPPFYFG